MSEFPPKTWQDIDSYDHAEIVAGYLSHERGDPVPGPNHSDGFRWGWTNRERDESPNDDGFDLIRFSYIANHPRQYHPELVN